MSPSSGGAVGTPIIVPPSGGAGSGGISTVVGGYADLIQECSAVKLARYAQIVGYDENPFWGINHNVGDQACRKIWMLSDRQMAAKYLCEAQIELEATLGFHLGFEWDEELKKDLKFPMLANYGYLIAFGIPGFADIALATAVDHTTDPATIGPLPTTVTDTSEVVIYHPGTNVEIIPRQVVIAGGMLTITIPWCRMVKEAYMDNPEAGWDYADHATWMETTVDVRRRYNDTSTQAKLYTNHTCSILCAESGCTEYTHTACGYIRNPEIGSVELHLADYVGGTWVKETNCCRGYNYAKLYYLSGKVMNPQLEDMVVRLAHAKMPKEPCGCDPVQKMWAEDRKMPEVYSRERINCTFGMSNGAWTAWKWAQDLKLVRGGIVG